MEDSRSLMQMSQSIPAWLSDYGTEVGFASVKKILVKDLLPHFQDPEADNKLGQAQATQLPVSCEHEVDFAEEPAPEPQPEVDFADLDSDPAGPQRREPCVDVTASLEVPGLLHIISNAGISLSSAMEYYDEAIYKLTKVSNIVNSKESKDRLYETCFANCIAGRELFRPLRAFRAKCHVERWGTVSHCVQAILADVEAPLRWGWSLDRYLNGSQSHPQLDRDAADPENPHRSRLDVVDEAITDPFWWGYLRMLSKIAETLNVLLQWAESCSCHWDMLQDALGQADEGNGNLPERVRADIASCPLRGRRCADLAGGDFMELLRNLCEERISRLLIDQLPTELTPEQRQTIVSDFERGRLQLITYFTMKLSHYDHAPYCVFGLAHRSSEVRHKCLKKIFDSDSDHCHPRVSRLKADPLARELELWEENGLSFPHGLCALRHLRTYIAECRMALSAERCQEAPHARTKREVLRCPSHSEALVSMAHRSACLESYLQLGPDEFQEIAGCLENVKHGRRACELLGLGQHPVSLENRMHPRDRAHWKVVYHNDAFSKYAAALPPVERHRPPEWPGDGDDGHQGGSDGHEEGNDEGNGHRDHSGHGQGHGSDKDQDNGDQDDPPHGQGPPDPAQGHGNDFDLDDDDAALRKFYYAEHLLQFFTENPSTTFSLRWVDHSVVSLRNALGVKHGKEVTDRLVFQGHELVAGPAGSQEILAGRRSVRKKALEPRAPGFLGIGRV